MYLRLRRISIVSVVTKRAPVMAKTISQPSKRTTKPRRAAADDDGNLIKSVGKALAILEELYASGRALRVGDLAARLDMSPSAVSRLVTTLGTSRLVDQDEESGRCYLGIGLSLFGHAALGRRELDQIALPVLADISRRFAAYASLCRMYRNKVIMIRGRTSETLQRDSSLMCVHPVHACASGKLLLAYLEPAELASVLDGHRLDPYTPRTITTIEALMGNLETIRRDGFAVDDQELLHDSRHVAAPIRDHTGLVVAALSVGGRTVEVQDQFEGLTQACVVGTLAISRQLGYRDQPGWSVHSGRAAEIHQGPP
jgi:DNA-binding IclR family transcriptional regulator